MTCRSWDCKNITGPPILALRVGNYGTKLFSKNLWPVDFFGYSNMSWEAFYAIKFSFGQSFQNSAAWQVGVDFLLIFFIKSTSHSMWCPPGVKRGLDLYLHIFSCLRIPQLCPCNNPGPTVKYLEWKKRVSHIEHFTVTILQWRHFGILLRTLKW